MNIAIVGATGLVGQKMIQVLEERKIKIDNFIPVASKKNVGKMCSFNGKEYPIVSINDAIGMRPNIALFSAGGSISLEYAPKFAEAGTKVIDNSSAWRMNENTKLVVPEVNAKILTKEDMIIANPNCSTIQLVVALQPLQEYTEIERIVVSTYQSITGSGIQAVNQMENERKGVDGEKLYPYEIDKNLIPHIDVFLDNDYTKEEQKIIDETKKIMSLPDLNITSTAVRVPVLGGHSESVNIEFKKEVSIAEIKELLAKSPGIKVLDDPSKNHYPMPITAYDNDIVWIGRIRKDFSRDNTINMWVVSDNLRKGAATNTVQIAEYLMANNLL